MRNFTGSVDCWGFLGVGGGLEAGSRGREGEGEGVMLEKMQF